MLRKKPKMFVCSIFFPLTPPVLHIFDRMLNWQKKTRLWQICTKTRALQNKTLWISVRTMNLVQFTVCSLGPPPEAWNLLMEPRFDMMRLCMFGNVEEMMRFRQVFVNVVLATDVCEQCPLQMSNSTLTYPFKILCRFLTRS